MVVLQQNYKTHLKNKHPAEDYNDLRARGQSSLFFSKSESDNKEDNELHFCKNIELAVLVVLKMKIFLTIRLLYLTKRVSKGCIHTP